MKQKSKNEVEVRTKPESNSQTLLKSLNYMFWLDYDANGLYSSFSDDKYLQKIFREYRGLRIMRDTNKEYRILEAIITQNTSVRMIKHMQRYLFVNCGNFLRKKCRLGYRASYLREIANALTEKKLSLEEIEKLPTKDAREYLMRFRGIGKKVADIILMYGFGRRDVFPMDVWVKKAIKREYFGRRDVSEEEIYKFALEYFGNHASIINLLIFNKERKRKEFYNFCVWK